MEVMNQNNGSNESDKDKNSRDSNSYVILC